jgi:general secretion pathway protein H
MLVLLIMGLAAGIMVLNFNGPNGSDLIKKQSQRLEVVFNMAADYAILNQRQLGLRVEEDTNSYHFLVLDEEQQWQQFDLDPTFAKHSLPELFSLRLSLTGLPWDTDQSLFSGQLFDEALSVKNDSVDIGNEEEKKLEPPQIFISASGEITPFSITLAYEPEFSDEIAVYYRINGQDSTPLIKEGPLDAP